MRTVVNRIPARGFLKLSAISRFSHATKSNNENKDEPLFTPAPDYMQAAICHTQGVHASKAVSWKQVSTPEMTYNLPFLVKVNAACFTLFDQHALQGPMAELGLRQPPYRIGRYFSGVIHDVVSPTHLGNFKIGDSIVGYAPEGGAVAQYIAISSNSIVHKPKALSFEEGAVFAHDGFAALNAINGVEKKENFLLVVGGETPTGIYSIIYGQLVKKFRVHAVCKDLESLNVLNPGPTRIVNMLRGEKWYSALQDVKYDMIVDCVGGAEIFNQGKTLVRRGGTFLSLYGDNLDKTGGMAQASNAGVTQMFRNFQHAVFGGSVQYVIQEVATEQYSAMQGFVDALNSAPKFTVPPFVEQVFEANNLGEFASCDSTEERPVIRIN
jgi:NADPH:quinone reductase-like Zn-dependent oxidoreductase